MSEHGAGQPAEQFVDIRQQREANLLGMWLFLATEALLFGGLFLAFAVHRARFPDAFAEAAGHLGLFLGAVNTAVLLSSGLTMALADAFAAKGRRREVLIHIGLTMVLALAFLAIKGYEWRHEYAQGLMPLLGLTFEYRGANAAGAQMFFDLYYAMTGLHALHMLIGVGLLAWLLAAAAKWREPARAARQVRIAGMYWAFVDVVWLFVFTCLYLLRS